MINERGAGSKPPLASRRRTSRPPAATFAAVISPAAEPPTTTTVPFFVSGWFSYTRPAHPIDPENAAAVPGSSTQFVSSCSQISVRPILAGSPHAELREWPQNYSESVVDGESAMLFSVCRGCRVAHLAFIGGAFETDDARQRGRRRENDGKQRKGDGKSAHQQRQSAGQGAHHVHGQHGASLPQAEIGKPVCGVVLARRCEGKQPAPASRNRDQRGVENRGSQDEHGNQPGRDQIGLRKTQFERQRRHQKTKKHGATVAHKNLGGLEVPP